MKASLKWPKDGDVYAGDALKGYSIHTPSLRKYLILKKQVQISQIEPIISSSTLRIYNIQLAKNHNCQVPTKMKFHNKEKLEDSDVCSCKGFTRPKRYILQKTVQIFLKQRELVRVGLSDTTNHLRS